MHLYSCEAFSFLSQLLLFRRKPWEFWRGSWFKVVRAGVVRRIETLVEPKYVSGKGFRPRLLTLALMVAGMCHQDQ